ncbi:unnamed protein product [Angiostrongylus costaricensis]|uniref:DAGKa domain-containing protein n=1 Tax=Angiostrongylus costaricensis TaxID=334426 RepID=A0A0R3PA88_ANGCS|nr:unnamed protein product [Angiostrongylus costaricensis]
MLSEWAGREDTTHSKLSMTTVKKLFLGTCDNGGAGGVGVFVNTGLAMNIDSFEQLTARLGRLPLKRSGSILTSRLLGRCRSR